MEWGFDIEGGMSVRGLIGAEGSTGSEEGRRATRSFQPASSTDVRREELDSRRVSPVGSRIRRSGSHPSSLARLLRRRRHRGDDPRGGQGGGAGREEQRAGCDRGSRGAGRAAPPGGSARTWPRPTSAEVCASPPRPMVVLGDDSTARGVGDFQAARVRARSARARAARAGDPGVAIRARVDDRREASARSDASMPAGGERVGGARGGVSEASEARAPHGQVDGRDRSILAPASATIKQISSGVD